MPGLVPAGGGFGMPTSPPVPVLAGGLAAVAAAAVQMKDADASQPWNKAVMKVAGSEALDWQLSDQVETVQVNATPALSAGPVYTTPVLPEPEPDRARRDEFAG